MYKTVVFTSIPHLGASPDGFLQCECCGNGVLEIKCPYNAREHSMSDAVMEGIIDFLETTPHGIVLKQSHQYSSSDCRGGSRNLGKGGLINIFTTGGRVREGARFHSDIQYIYITRYPD